MKFVAYRIHYHRCKRVPLCTIRKLPRRFTFAKTERALVHLADPLAKLTCTEDADIPDLVVASTRLFEPHLIPGELPHFTDMFS